MRRLAIVLIGLLALSACATTLEQAPPPAQFRAPVLVYSWLGLDVPPGVDVYNGPADGYAAVDEFFPEPTLNATAHCIAERESHHYPTADNGSYHGLFQLGNQFFGTLVAAAGTLRQWPWWWSARQNALAARIIYNQSGFRPWGGGC